jgi:hypothetical protein
MVLQRRNIITEGERNRILGLYGRPQSSDTIVITEWLSPDEKYCIFFDDLIDIEKKVKIGNIWENFENFKFFLKHSFEVATNIPQEIKESVITSINSFLITESNQNMVGLKPYVKEFLSEQNFFSDLSTWVTDTAKSTVQGVSDFATTSWEGLKKTYNYIKDAEWSKAFEMIKKGVLYVARSIRSMLYHPVGILLDAILIATGVGKGFQFAIWGTVVALDVYELISGNYEDPDLAMPWRLLFLGVDILGLATTAIAAKGAKTVLSGLVKRFGKGIDGITSAVQSSKFLQDTIKRILGSTQSAGGLMQKAATHLQTKAPKIFNFLKGAFSAVGGFIKKMVELLTSLVKGTYKAISAPGKGVKSVLGGGKLGSAAQASLNVGVPIAALGTYQTGQERKQNDEFMAALQSNNIEPDYSQVEW